MSCGVTALSSLCRGWSLRSRYLSHLLFCSCHLCYFILRRTRRSSPSPHFPLLCRRSGGVECECVSPCARLRYLRARLVLRPIENVDRGLYPRLPSLDREVVRTSLNSSSPVPPSPLLLPTRLPLLSHQSSLDQRLGTCAVHPAAMYPQNGAPVAPPQKPETFMLSSEAQQRLPQDAQVALQQVDNRMSWLIFSLIVLRVKDP